MNDDLEDIREPEKPNGMVLSLTPQLQRSLYGRSSSSIKISLNHGKVAEVAHEAPARVFL